MHVANLYIDSCSDLSLTNGVINYNMGSPRPVNTVATYTCNNGYTLRGDTTRTCGSDGQWSGNDPTCQGKSPLTTDYLSYVPPQLLSALTYLPSTTELFHTAPEQLTTDQLEQRPPISVLVATVLMELSPGCV